jgi:hypothetical protein
LAAWWAILVAFGFLFFGIYHATGWISGSILPLLCLSAALGLVFIWKRSHRWTPDYRQIARQIEQHHPELHALLLTAVEQQPDPATGQFNFLQERLLRQVVAESAHANWLETVSTRQLLAGQVLQVAAFVLFVWVLSGLRVRHQEAIALAKPTRVQVTPGDTSLERGNGLAVLARFDGPLPADVTLVVRPDAQPERRLSLVKSLNDPVFGGTIQEVTNTLTYHVTYSGGRSGDFRVSVFEYPRLERADAHLIYPAYTGLGEKKIEDTRRVTAVEGSRLDLSLQLNKPVASARLIARDKTVVPLTVPTNRANASLAGFTLKTNQVFDLVLVDEAGRSNKVPTQIVLEVLTNRVPELAFTFPKGDQRVSALEEINFQAEASDDFGLKNYGITYRLTGGKAVSVPLGTTTIPHEKRQFSHTVRLEDLGAQPDQLLSYFLWADDVGPDGQVRRTASDMFYAEVRPFDEIFRESQGRPRSEEQDQGNSPSMKLAELEKQIMNATWRLQRQNAIGLDDEASSGKGASPRPISPNYPKDVDVVKQSQDEALRQARAAKGESRSPQTKALWESVEKEMQRAADQLAKASKSVEPLPGAVSAEQGAYEALLKLAAHEYNVAQGGRNSSRSGNQPNQRQIDQLDLKQSENRYENEKAAAKQNPQQREQLQVLNRLKELAQRQQDLNQRLKELQTALQEAKTDQEKEDIRRRLKRLREEEQQMLADVDELMQRMDRPDNQSRMADARQQLEQSRNQIQRTSEMIDQNAVSQALSSGTRAERQLQDLRDDFRKKNSAQFAEEMRKMRSDARALDQKEEQINDQLKSLAQSQRKTLGDTGETKQLLDQLGQQTQKMTNLMDQLSRVSQEAEVSEPLLSKQLYDTLRKASQGNPDQALNKAGELLKLSFFNEAGQFEQRARKDISDMKQGVERAAESVLGDETEALRLARNELDDLAKQIEKELEQSGQASGSTNSPAGAQSEQGQKTGGSDQGKQQGSAQSDSGQLAQDSQNGQSPDGQNGQNGQRSDQNGSPQGAAGQRSAQPGDRANAGQGGEQGQQQMAGQGDPNQQSQQNSNRQGQGGRRQRASLSGQQGQQGGQQGQQAGQQQGQQAGGQGGRGGQQGRQPGQQPGRQPGQQPGGQPGARGAGNQMAGGGGGEGGDNVGQRPLTGEGYAEWSDRLRDVEEMLDFPDLRNEVAGVREQARTLRVDYKKHAKAPQPSEVRTKIAEPLVEVRNRINEELARRESKDSLVPIDRDPVPQKFTDLVRRYYEKLGSGEKPPAPERE